MSTESIPTAAGIDGTSIIGTDSLQDTSSLAFDGTVAVAQTSTTSSATSPSATPAPSPPQPNAQTSPGKIAGAPHKHSSSTGALAGGVCGGVLLLTVLAFLLLRRRRRRRVGHPLVPAPFTRMSSENSIYPWIQSSAVRARAAPPPPDIVQHKAPGKGLIQQGTPTPESAAPPTSSQTTDEKNVIPMVPPSEEPEDASVSPQGNSREAILAQEVVALRMRIRAMESLQGEGPSSGRASASVSDAPPDYEDEGIPL